MRRLAAIASLLVAVLLAGCGDSDAEATRAKLFKPFVERVQPANYDVAESLFPETYSRTHDVVVLRTDANKPVSALALQLDGASCTVTFASQAADGEWQTLSAPLDEAVARQIFHAVALRLNHNITLSPVRRRPAHDGDLWIFQRNANGSVAAALVTFEAALGNPAARTFIDDLLGGLQRLAITGGSDRDALMTELDRLATEIILKDPQP